MYNRIWVWIVRTCSFSLPEAGNRLAGTRESVAAQELVVRISEIGNQNRISPSRHSSVCDVECINLRSLQSRWERCAFFLKVGRVSDDVIFRVVLLRNAGNWDAGYGDRMRAATALELHAGTRSRSILHVCRFPLISGYSSATLIRTAAACSLASCSSNTSYSKTRRRRESRLSDAQQFEARRVFLSTARTIPYSRPAISTAYTRAWRFLSLHDAPYQRFDFGATFDFGLRSPVPPRRITRLGERTPRADRHRLSQHHCSLDNGRRRSERFHGEYVEQEGKGRGGGRGC